MKILLLNKPDTNIKLLTEIARKTKSFNLTCGLEPRGLISTIKLFYNAKKDLYALQNPGQVLMHFNYTFIGLGDYNTALVISHLSQLNVTFTNTHNPDICIVLFSGTLNIWKAAIVDLSSSLVSSDVREFANDIWRIFNEMNLNHIFSDYRRKSLNDTTFVLEKK